MWSVVLFLIVLGLPAVLLCEKLNRRWGDWKWGDSNLSDLGDWKWGDWGDTAIGAPESWSARCVDKGWLRFQRPDGLWTWERPLIDENQYWRRVRDLNALGMNGERVENQRLHNELAAHEVVKRDLGTQELDVQATPVVNTIGSPEDDPYFVRLRAQRREREEAERKRIENVPRQAQTVSTQP